jgi:hypothetical protein
MRARFLTRRSAVSGARSAVSGARRPDNRPQTESLCSVPEYAKALQTATKRAPQRAPQRDTLPDMRTGAPISETELAVRMPHALRDALEESAARNGRTVSGEARWALQRYLNANADTAATAAAHDGNGTRT